MMKEKIFQLRIKSSLFGEYLDLIVSKKFDDLKLVMDVIDKYSDQKKFMVIVDENDNLILVSKDMSYLLKEAMEISEGDQTPVFHIPDEYLHRKMRENRLNCIHVNEGQIKELCDHSLTIDCLGENVHFLHFNREAE